MFPVNLLRVEHGMLQGFDPFAERLGGTDKAIAALQALKRFES